MTKSNLDLARECGGDVMYPPGHSLHRVVMPAGALDAFAERIRADALAAANPSPVVNQSLTTVQPSPAAVDRKPLTDEQKYVLIKEYLGLDRRRDATVIDRCTGRFTDAARYFELIDASIEAGHGITEQQGGEP